MNIDDIVKRAIEEFIEEQSELLKDDVNEQTISHQLAIKLAYLFPDYHIDCEYNRNGNDVKKLIYAVSSKSKPKKRNIVPDIIVHKRHTNNNLLAIEIKKTTNPEDSIKDLNKLAAFKEQLGYKHTLFVRFKTGISTPGIDEFDFE